MSLLLSTLRNNSLSNPDLTGENFATDSSFSPTVSFTTAGQMKAVQRLAKVRRKMVTDRAYKPWLVNLIVRLGLHDGIGENVPVILYAKSAQPAHAASFGYKLWARLARHGLPKTAPWPAEDSETTVELMDDNDFARILKDAQHPARISRNWIGGHPLDPWCMVIGDREMADELLMNLKQRGPTFGGTSMREDLPPELGGWGHERPASLDPYNEDP
jgi:hypothetical protein